RGGVVPGPPRKVYPFVYVGVYLLGRSLGSLGMQCPQCRQSNPPGTKFCGECGTRLQSVCPACHAANPPTNKFCSECGQRLAGDPPTPAPATPSATIPAAAPAATTARFASPEAYTPRHLAEKILTSKAAIEGERKIVTVMFSDVSGFTA